MESVIEFKRDVYRSALNELVRYLPGTHHHPEPEGAKAHTLVVPGEST